MEHFLNLLRFYFLAIVVSLAEVNSLKFSTGLGISYFNKSHLLHDPMLIQVTERLLNKYWEKHFYFNKIITKMTDLNHTSE